MTIDEIKNLAEDGLRIAEATLSEEEIRSIKGWFPGVSAFCTDARTRLPRLARIVLAAIDCSEPDVPALSSPEYKEGYRIARWQMRRAIEEAAE